MESVESKPEGLYENPFSVDIILALLLFKNFFPPKLSPRD